MKIAWRVAAVCLAAPVCFAPSVLYAPVGFLRFVIGVLSVIYGGVAVLFVCGAFSSAYGDDRADYPVDIRLRMAMAVMPFMVVVSLVGLEWASGEVSSDVGGSFAMASAFASPFALSALWGFLMSTLPTRTTGSVAEGAVEYGE